MTGPEHVTKLEQRYRRVLRLLPKTYRDERADEMLSALLDKTGDGQEWPGDRETVSLAALSLRLRLGAASNGAPSAFGDIARPAILVNLVLMTGIECFAFADGLRLGLITGWSFPPMAGLVAALIFGQHRLGSGSALIAVALMTAETWHGQGGHYTFGSGSAVSYWSLFAGFKAFPLLAVLPAFRRKAPRLSERRPIATAAVVEGAAVCVASASLLWSARARRLAAA